jgi:hypothetical protein
MLVGLVTMPTARTLPELRPSAPPTPSHSEPAHTLLMHATGFSSHWSGPTITHHCWLPQAHPAAHSFRLTPCRVLPRHCLLAGSSLNGGRTTVPAPPPGGSGGVPLVAIIGAVAGVLAVALIAAVVLLTRRARKRNNLAAQAAAGGPAGYPGMPPQGAYGAAYGAAGTASAYGSSGRMTDVEASQGLSRGMSLPGSVSTMGSGGAPQVLFHMGAPPAQPPLYHGPPGTGNAYSGGMPGGMAAPGQPASSGMAYRI